MVMTEQEIFESFRKSLEDFAGVPASDVTRGADLADDLNVDSLSMVEVVVSAQDKFGIEIPDADLKYLRTVQDVIAYVRNAQSAGAPA
jgi:acyl carrier protein